MSSRSNMGRQQPFSKVLFGSQQQQSQYQQQQQQQQQSQYQLQQQRQRMLSNQQVTNQQVSNQQVSNRVNETLIVPSNQQQLLSGQQQTQQQTQTQQQQIPLRNGHKQMIPLDDLLPILQQYGLVGNNNLMASILAASQEHDHKKPLGGVWIMCHKKAELHDMTGDRQGYIDFIKWLASIFWCEECADDFRQYLKDHPPENEYYMSSYMFDFHNHVSSKVGKTTMVWDTYVELYRKHPENICPDCHKKPVISKGGNISNYNILFIS